MAVNFLVAMRLTEQVSRPLRRASSSANQMTKSADRMSTQLQATNAVLVGTAAAAVATVGALSAAAAGLEDSLARLETVTRSTSSTVESAMGNSEDAAREFSSQFTATAGEFIDAQFQIATAGIAVEQQVAATGAAFKLARATVGEFTQSAQLLGSFLNTFGKSAEFNYLRPAEKVEAITDRLTTAVQRFQVTLPVLAESFKFIVGPASTLNLNLGEVTAAIGVLNTAGFRGTLAGTALSNVFNKLDRAVEKLDLNPDKFINVNGELKSMASFFEELNRALGDSTPLEKQSKLIETFDIRAGRVIKTILDNIDALKSFRGELDISTGSTERLAQIVESTTSSQLKKFLNQLQNIATTIGNGLNKSLKPLAMLLNKAAKAVAGFVKRNEFLVSSIVLITTSILALAVAISALSIIFGVLGVGMAALISKSIVFRVGLFALKFAFEAIVLTGAHLVKTLLTVAQIMGGAIISSFARAGNEVLLFRNKIALASKALVVFVKRAAVAAIASLGVIGGIFAIAAAAGIALGLAVRGLVGAFSGTDEVVVNTTNSLEDLNKKFGNSIERTASLAAELKRLSITVKDNVDIPLRSGETLGQLPFAQAATKIKRDDPTITRAEALNTAVKAAGNFKGIMKQVALATGEGIKPTQQYGQALLDIIKATDKTFDATDDLGNAQKVLTTFIRGSATAFSVLANSNEQAAESIKLILSGYDKLGKKSTTVARAVVKESIFQAMSSGIDELRDSTNEGVQDVVAFFDQAKSAADEFAASGGESFVFAEKVGDTFVELTSQSTQFNKLLNRTSGSVDKINQGFFKVKFTAARLIGIVDGISTSIAQTKSAMKSVTNLFKLASLGGASFANAQDKAADRIKEAERSYKDVVKIIKVAAAEVKRLKDSNLVGTTAFKDAKAFADSLEEIKTELLFEIDEGKALQETNRVFVAIARQAGGKLSSQAVKDITTLGAAFSSTLTDALKGVTKGASLFTALRDDFKGKFIDEIQGDISKLFGSKFTGQFRKAVNIAKGIAEDANIAGTLVSGLADGSLPKQINDAINKALPQIKGLTGGDIFNLSGDNKLAEEFKSISTDASVALVTAGAQSASALERLQGILGSGPGQTFNELTDQATRLRALLVTASNSGAGDAIRPIQDALKGTLDAIKAIGTTSEVDKFTASAETVKASLGTGAGLLATVIDRIPAAFKDSVELLKEGFAQLFSTDSAQVATSTIQSLKDSQNQRKLDINLGDLASTLTVAVNGEGGTGTSSGAFLEEDEIREIVEAARLQLEQDVDQKLTQLEDELRNR